MLRKTSLFVSFLLFSSMFSYAAADVSIVNEVSSANEAKSSSVFKKQSAVIFSKKIKNLNLKKAYNLQKAFVKNSVSKGVDIVGYKAGLTSADAYSQQGLSEPISGVLLHAPLAGNKGVVSWKDGSNLMLEQEIAYQISTPISKKLAASQLMEHVAFVAPAIEIPDINFVGKEFNGLDIIANNTMAHKLMIGEWQKLDSFKTLDALSLSLSCKGKLLSEGKGSNALGSQSQALLWLINHIVEQGYQIKKGQVLITGNLIKMIPAKPCAYVASFGSMGSMELVVTP